MHTSQPYISTRPRVDPLGNTRWAWLPCRDAETKHRKHQESGHHKQRLHQLRLTSAVMQQSTAHLSQLAAAAAVHHTISPQEDGVVLAACHALNVLPHQRLDAGRHSTVLVGTCVQYRAAVQGAVTGAQCWLSLQVMCAGCFMKLLAQPDSIQPQLAYQNNLLQRPPAALQAKREPPKPQTRPSPCPSAPNCPWPQL